MTFALRPYQADAVAAIRDSWQRVQSTMVELATGLGKTEIFTEIARTWDKGRVMVVCPGIPLIAQAAKKIRNRTGIQPNIEQGSEWSAEGAWWKNKFVVASKQSLCSVSKATGEKRYQRFEDIGLVIIDECHLSITNEYEGILNHFRNQGAKVLGVTATAKRHDKRAMGMFYEDCPYQFGIADAVEQGWLVSAVAHCVQLKTLDLSDVKTKQTVHGKDFNEKQLNEKLEATETVYEIAEVTARESGKAKTVVYCSSVDEAKLVAERLCDNYGLKAGWIASDVKRCTEQRRQEVLESFTKDPNGIQIVCNVGILTTGWDYPALEHIVMARPTRSLSLYTQIFGRGTRPLAGTVDFPDSTPELRKASIAASAKPFFRVTDLVDASMEHKIVTSMDVLGGKYSIEVVERAKKDALNKQEGGPVTVDEALAAAKLRIQEEEEAEERRRRARIQARAEYEKRQVDPFDQYSRVVGGVKKDKSRCHMTFGKYKGKNVSDVPTGYLKWFIAEMTGLPGWLRHGIETELAGRKGSPSSPHSSPKKSMSLDEVNNLLQEFNRRWQG